MVKGNRRQGANLTTIPPTTPQIKSHWSMYKREKGGFGALLGTAIKYIDLQFPNKEREMNGNVGKTRPSPGW